MQHLYHYHYSRNLIPECWERPERVFPLVPTPMCITHLADEILSRKARLIIPAKVEVRTCCEVPTVLNSTQIVWLSYRKYCILNQSSFCVIKFFPTNDLPQKIMDTVYGITIWFYAIDFLVAMLFDSKNIDSIILRFGCETLFKINLKENKTWYYLWMIKLQRTSICFCLGPSLCSWQMIHQCDTMRFPFCSVQTKHPDQDFSTSVAASIDHFSNSCQVGLGIHHKTYHKEY